MGLLEGKKGKISHLVLCYCWLVVFQSHFLVHYQGGGALNVISDMICRSLNYTFSCLRAENCRRRGFIIIFLSFIILFFAHDFKRGTAEEEAGGSGRCTRSLHSRHTRREGARELLGSEREPGWSDEVRARRETMEPRCRRVTESPQTANS